MRGADSNQHDLRQLRGLRGLQDVRAGAGTDVPSDMPGYSEITGRNIQGQIANNLSKKDYSQRVGTMPTSR